MGKLFFGDNLNELRDHFHDESVDLVYLDPPFNSKRDYNVLFKTPKGQSSDAQITAFEDSWVWGDQAEREFTELLHQCNTDVCDMIRNMRQFLKDTPIMAYLVMMTNRLIELHRVLKPTGSLYLHCDPTASHYLKIILDTIFGPQYFRNEIIWKRTSAHNDPKRYGNNYDCILYFSKGDTLNWNPLHSPYSEDYVSSHYSQKDSAGYYTTRDLTAPDHGSPSPGLRYAWKGVNPPSGRTWSCVIEKMTEYEANGLLSYSKDGMPRLKRYLGKMPGVPIQALLSGKVNSDTKQGSG
jgi:site-specific DNA-methyltransferase (adenine-specific)